MKRKLNKKTHFIFKLNIFKLLSIVLLVVFVLFTPLLVKTSIKINKIECVSQYEKCPNDLENFLNSFVGFNYHVVKKNMTSYLSTNYLVNDYLIQYKIPNTLKVELNIKKYTNSFNFAGDTQYFLITSDGVVIDIKNETSVPNVIIHDFNIFKTGEQSLYKPGDKVDEKIIFAGSIVNNLNYLFSINEINLYKEYLTAVSNEGINIIIPTTGDKDLIVGSLRLIFSRLNQGTEGIRMEEVREIDLRYKNPILRRK